MITTKTKELSYVEQGKDLIIKVKYDITIKDYANYFTDILNPTEEELTMFSLDCGEDVDKIKKLLLQHKSLPDLIRNLNLRYHHMLNVNIMFGLGIP